ncbi:aa3-type cytochrome oxidase subunit III [Actinomadura madurae]|uniref:cytochrome-c oxidase n=2 Tax=Thermomonosporaceae TaxID=2012 RepID=A0A1I4WZG9_9ACTN|nr:cytochrome c oxidase subunit 3 [Actinomadura madurae]SPT62865.1 Cytochrome c oxidase subunit 3 [Actinomadura madurae]
MRHSRDGGAIMLPVTASAIETTPHARANRPNLVSVGTIVWLSSELMFFAALFAMFFTIRSVTIGQSGHDAWPGAPLDLPLSAVNTTILVLSSVTCQMGVFKAEAGKVGRDGGVLNVARWGLREWYVLSFLMGAYFVAGQGFEYYNLVVHDGLTFSSSAYGSVFYLATGFHGLHVIGGLVAFLFLLGRTYAAKRWTHEQATSAIVVSYYWHFVDVVWIGLFSVVYLLDL